MNTIFIILISDLSFQISKVCVNNQHLIQVGYCCVSLDEIEPMSQFPPNPYASNIHFVKADNTLVSILVLRVSMSDKNNLLLGDP